MKACLRFLGALVWALVAGVAQGLAEAAAEDPELQRRKRKRN